MLLAEEDTIKLLWERVTYINNIRMGMFRFHLAVAGVLTALLVQKLDLRMCPVLPPQGIAVIGWISLGLFLVGVSIFIFDLWALAHLKATTLEIAKLFTGSRPSVRPLGKPWFGFDEDFWIVVPMMLINSALLWAFVYAFSCGFRIQAYLATGVAALAFLAQTVMNRTLPGSWAPRLGALPDGYPLLQDGNTPQSSTKRKKQNSRGRNPTKT